MQARKITVLAAAFALAGCSGRVEGQVAQETSTAALGDPAVLPLVTLQGRIVGSDGAPLAGADVVRLALDPYLVPVLHAQSDATGSFVVGPVLADSREWLTFQMPGHVSLYQAFETTADARQAMPAAALPSDAEGLALAERYGVTLDGTKSVLRIPVVTSGPGPAMPAAAGTFQVTFAPATDGIVFCTDGEAIAFNVASGGLFDVTVSRAGRSCAPSVHLELAAPDGSVRVGALEGFFTVGPTIACP